MGNSKFLGLNNKGQGLVSGWIGLVIVLIVLIGVGIPLVLDAINSTNITGPNASLIKTVLDFVVVFMALGSIPYLSRKVGTSMLSMSLRILIFPCLFGYE